MLPACQCGDRARLLHERASVVPDRVTMARRAKVRLKADTTSAPDKTAPAGYAVVAGRTPPPHRGSSYAVSCTKTTLYRRKQVADTAAARRELV